MVGGAVSVAHIHIDLDTHTHVQYAGMSAHTHTQERKNESWVYEQRIRGADCRQQKGEDKLGRERRRDDRHCVLKAVHVSYVSKTGKKKNLLSEHAVFSRTVLHHIQTVKHIHTQICPVQLQPFHHSEIQRKPQQALLSLPHLFDYIS